MKRQSKFRGLIKNSDIDKFIYGDLINYKSGEVAILETPFDKYGVEATQIFRRTLVFKDSVSEFTGEIDENKNEIYEGDICEIEFNEFYSNETFVAEIGDKIKGIVKLKDAMFIIELEDNSFVTFNEVNNEEMNIKIIGNSYIGR